MRIFFALLVFAIPFYSSVSFGANSIWDSGAIGDMKNLKIQVEKIGIDVNAVDSMGLTLLVHAITQWAS